MRKGLVAILSVLYITTASGATIRLHYCMGKLVNWSLWDNHSKKCGKCGMAKHDNEKKGCCKDESKYIKNITEHKSAEYAFQLLQLNSFAIQTSFLHTLVYYFNSATQENPLSNSPPKQNSLSIHVLNCIFQI